MVPCSWLQDTSQATKTIIIVSSAITLHYHNVGVIFGNIMVTLRENICHWHPTQSHNSPQNIPYLRRERSEFLTIVGGVNDDGGGHSFGNCI
mmetsp:Transcript_17176/g.32220  ORF Transcript_17176/g.32220 Transcript_17176/m.32220 type:complete len:92 (-) Transcript_17176:3817-4092(-)